MRWRGWPVDLSFALLTTAAAALVADPWPAAIIFGLSVAAVRRWPALVVGVQTVLLVASGSGKTTYIAALALIMLLMALASLAFRSGWVAVGVGYAATMLATLVFTTGKSVGPAALDPVRTIGWVGLTAGAVAFGRYLRGVRHVAEITEERATEARVWRGVETRAARLAERSRLARDLHDIMAHHVGAMTLRANSGRLALDTSQDVAAARAALVDVATAGRQVLDELRGLLTVLRDPDAIDEEPLVTEPKAAMADAVARLRTAGVPLHLELDPRLDNASLLVRATVARIVQEALTNVLKHAGPGTATRLIAIVEPAGTIWLQVVNDPPGGQPAALAALPSSGHGLAGMRDRVALLGGTLIAGPTSDRGWSVTARLPAPSAEGDRE